MLINLDPEKPFSIARGDRIAQLVVIPFVHADISIVQNLDETDRGQGGFGSSGRA